ncbi:MAG: NAD(P)H-hydrate dehydratase [Candidatus Abyssobacteria bacterium SURF_5]|uniref:ADP-dependent (S)-NAD(P)H-hydrate dehydratase n=1 Tax=Abyssobacteria bacterium (strain SURF_5) TaxID=2093360 RepID=A0A3A4P0C4_ABYX5|nr:MAG: NAD(P)H-hydrate dehydratase [Candidatus Abyssubacteria bacterium SURF_5]
MIAQITLQQARSLLPARPSDSHKGTYGYLLVIAGSVGLTGAACMTCEAALRAGAGMVTLGVPRSLNPAMEARLTETMTRPLAETSAQSLSLSAFDEIAELAKRMHVMAVGPGLSTHPETQQLVRKIARDIHLPMVIDADALNALSGRTELLSARTEPTIICPHPGEFSRLAQLPIADIQNNRPRLAREFADQWRVELVIKGAPSLVATTDGRTYVNTTGNAGMATAGSGDVLTGILAALLCQGVKAADAAVLGTYLHGLAGDVAAHRYSMWGMIATDITHCLPDAWRKLSWR